MHSNHGETSRNLKISIIDDLKNISHNLEFGFGEADDLEYFVREALANIRAEYKKHNQDVTVYEKNNFQKIRHFSAHSVSENIELIVVRKKTPIETVKLNHSTLSNSQNLLHEKNNSNSKSQFNGEHKEDPQHEVSNLIKSDLHKSSQVHEEEPEKQHHESQKASFSQAENQDNNEKIQDHNLGNTKKMIARTGRKQHTYSDVGNLIFHIPNQATNEENNNHGENVIHVEVVQDLAQNKHENLDKNKHENSHTDSHLVESKIIAASDQNKHHEEPQHVVETHEPEPVIVKKRVIQQYKTSQLWVEPLDGQFPVYSKSFIRPPFSFLPVGVTFTKAPTPCYIKYEVLCVPKAASKQEIFKGIEIKSNGEIKVVDKAALEKFKGIIPEVLKRLAVSISEGRGVVGVSLPVRIFEPRSLLERIIDYWSFGPVFLTQAGKLEDKIERFKKVITFAVAGLYVSASQSKPFNPILGETFQGGFDDGTEIFCEHTSHHPPISNFLCVNKFWKMSGRYEFIGDLQTNHLIVYVDGPNNIVFNDGQKITYSYPITKIGGMLWGDRNIKYCGNLRFVDKVNKLKAIVKIGDKKKYDAIVGKLYITNKPDNLSTKSKPLDRKKDQNKLDKAFHDCEKVICDITGSILQSISFGKDEYWNIDKFRPYRVIPAKNVLPSDVRFREDLIWLKHNNLKNSEEWKLRLEELQRAEKKLRLDHAKNKK